METVPGWTVGGLEVKDFDAAVETLRQHQIRFFTWTAGFPSCQMVVGLRSGWQQTDASSTQVVLLGAKPRSEARRRGEMSVKIEGAIAGDGYPPFALPHLSYVRGSSRFLRWS
jgi:hypothetical protein